MLVLRLAFKAPSDEDFGSDVSDDLTAEIDDMDVLEGKTSKVLTLRIPT